MTQRVGDEEGFVWPDSLEVDDRVTFDGDEYVVAGTGSGEATLERVGDDSIIVEVFRWAITNEVGIELKTDVTQEEFGDLVEEATDE